VNTRNDPVSDPSALGALFDALAAAPHAHDFFHALRRIESMTPLAPRLGRALRPSLEPVRLGQDPELDFAPASLVSLRTQTHAPPRLGVRFLGLFGPHGPLPLHLTEYARERERHHADPGFARFADLFHHRLLSLFYRAWAEAQPTVHADRPDDDQFAKWVGALFGIAPAEFRARDAVPDAAKRFQAGTLSRGVKNAEGLETLLREHLQVPVRVQPFVGHWMRLRPQDRTRLGRAGEASAQLGRSAVAGSKVWDRQCKFRVCVGPLSWVQYESFLPGGRSLPVLRDWVRQFAGLERKWDLQLTLKAGEVPRARLGRDGTARLGLSMWLGGARQRVIPAKAGIHAGRSLTSVDPSVRWDDSLVVDRDDLVLHPESH
jgi:type VI secretion system protein ImpH